MKRTIAAGLSAALLCGMVVPAFAADTKTATNTTGTTQTQPTAPVKLTFDKLEETVRQTSTSKAISSFPSRFRPTRSRLRSCRKR